MRVMALLVIVSALSAPLGANQANGSANGALTCTAFAVSTGGVQTPSIATTVDIVVNRFSPDAERQRLLEALKRGQGAMLEMLRDLPRIGYIRTPNSVGWDLHFAQVAPGEEGDRRIVIATDRPISFWEAANQPRTMDYPFMFIELRLDGEGEGQGHLSLATQVIATSDGRYVQLENYEAQPVRLNEVKCR